MHHTFQMRSYVVLYIVHNWIQYAKTVCRKHIFWTKIHMLLSTSHGNEPTQLEV